MRVAFAGTPEFAQAALARLHDAGFTVPLVLTQPDRPAGRGMKLQASPVKEFAVARGIPVAQPHGLRLDGKFADDAQELAARGGLVRTPQPDDGVTYARKIDKAEAAIDWREPAERIERRIRAFDPFPGASTTLNGDTVKVWRAAVVDGSGAPGEVL